MADNVYNGELTMTDDWGDVGGLPASGSAVQKFIKDQINGKPGYFYSHDDESNNQNILLGFVDEASYLKWMDETNGDVSKKDYFISETRINKSTPQPYDTVSLENKEDGNVIISTDGTVVIKVKFNSTNYKPEGGEMIATPTNEDGLLVVEKRSGSNWQQLFTSTISSKQVVEVDLTDYLNDGSHEIRMRVTGETTQLSTSWVSWDVTKTILDITFATPWQNPQTSQTMSLSYYITGEVNKYLNIKISGVGGESERLIERAIGMNVYNVSSGTPFNIQITDTAADAYKVATQGIHNIEAWITTKIDGRIVAESEHLENQILMNVDSNDTTSYIILNNVKTTLPNWTRQTLFQYAVFNNTLNSIPVSFIMSNYNTNEEYLKFEEVVNKGQVYTYSNTIEVEGNDEKLYAKLEIKSEGKDLIAPLAITIDNVGGYSPTAGADFIFNPRSRSNNVENPAYIVNGVTNDVINSTWEGFTFGRDEWIEDNDGNKCLRVIGGQVVEIDYNPFLDWGVDNSCTIEMSVATRNVVDESIPVLKICRYKNNSTNFEGWEMKPLEAAFMTTNQVNRLNQDIWFQEATPTHIAINIMHNMYSGINLVRIFVNGIINREFEYTDDTLSDGNNAPNQRKIIIGDKNANADIDVYSIRVYKKKLSSKDVMQDYIASLPTVEQKNMIQLANDILGGDGNINYDKAKEKYNTLLWKYCEGVEGSTTKMATYGDTDKKFKGDLVINVIKDNGELDRERSGTINDMTTKGQGTSSMSYWKWNQRWEFKEYEDEDKAKGYRDSVFTTIDGEEKNASWQPAEGMPFAKRLDGKINWASPMQSHKIGSTGLYNDVWKKVIGTSEIIDEGATENGKSFTGTPNGYASCRVAVIQKPFMVFVQESRDVAPVFYGLYTMGPSKGDKPTFGYNKKDWPNFVMMEGCDNGAPLVSCAVPWNEKDIIIPSKLDDGDVVGEVYQYKGEDQWEVSMGSTDYDAVNLAGEDKSKINPVLLKFKELNNFCYLLNPNLKVWDGTATQLKTSEEALDTSSFYWVTKDGDGNRKFNVYRYDDVKKAWVNAGIEYVSENDYEVLNLVDQTGFTPTSGSYDVWNQQFINKRAELFSQGIEQFVDKRELMYTMQILKLIAASDNRAKNTYIYNVGEVDESGNVTSKFRFFQDDLDTIFSLNNTGQKEKPYYVEEHDVNTKGENYWNASKNAFYCLAELAWEVDLRSMMREILSAMTELGGSVIGCFDKYYGSITEYFPMIAYNEIARLLYEDACVNKKNGAYGSSVDPLSQCVGDQHEAERQWQMRRSIYMSSYAQHGEFGYKDGAGLGAGAMSFRSTLIGNNKPTYKFKVTPYMWLYPSMAVGQSDQMPKNAKNTAIPPRVQAGETVEFDFSTDGNTNLTMRGANYYSKIGDLGNISAASDFTLVGNRLTEFVVTDDNVDKYNAIVFRPNNVTLSGEMPAVKKFVVNGDVYEGTSIFIGQLNLKNMWKLEEVDLTSTSITSLELPDNSNIHTLTVPDTIEVLNLTNHKYLTNLTYNSLTNVYKLTLKGCPGLDTLKILNDIIESGASLENVEITDINWEGVSYETLKYLINVYNCNLQGHIKINDDVVVGFDDKMSLLDKFGNIDDPENDLWIEYTRYTLSDPSNVGIKGYSNVYENGMYQYSLNYPSMTEGISGNDFVGVTWKLSSQKFGTIDEKSGVFMFKDDSTIVNQNQRKITVECTVTRIINGQPVSFKTSKTINLYQDLAKVGDYVYADGTYSSPSDYLGDKSIIGTCFYVDGSKDPKTQKRLAVAREIIDAPLSWGLMPNDGYNYIDSYLVDNEYCRNTSGQSANFDSGYSWYIGIKLAQASIKGDATVEGTAAGNIGWIDGLSIGKSVSNKIIAHRKGIKGDSTMVNPENYTSAGYSNELEYLKYILSSATGAKANKYYPAASCCYAYEPTNLMNGEKLNDKFKTHNWFLPSSGELVHIWYYLHTKMDANRTNSLPSFNYYDVEKVPANTFLWSSTECATDVATGSSVGANAWGMIFRLNTNQFNLQSPNCYFNGGASVEEYGKKSYKGKVIPVVQF